MTPLPASALAFALLALAVAGTGAYEPVLDQNAAYVRAGPKQARRDTRSCLRAGEFERSPTHPDVTRADDNRAVDLFAKKDGGRDPAFERAVERCLEQKGYKVNGWERQL